MFDMRMHRILPKWFSISSSKVVPVKRVSNETLLRIVEGPGLLLLKKQMISKILKLSENEQQYPKILVLSLIFFTCVFFPDS